MPWIPSESFTFVLNESTCCWINMSRVETRELRETLDILYFILSSCVAHNATKTDWMEHRNINQSNILCHHRSPGSAVGWTALTGFANILENHSRKLSGSHYMMPGRSWATLMATLTPTCEASTGSKFSVSGESIWTRNSDLRATYPGDSAYRIWPSSCSWIRVHNQLNALVGITRTISMRAMTLQNLSL